ncbi:MAG: DNA-binding response regulator [Cyanobacteria bacterium J149]|nr:MAG: DNA-binding response regulator [Cyanobacteria bacterium J149]
MVGVNITIVEGNPHLRSLLGWHLQQAGYSIKQCGTIKQARYQLSQYRPKLVVVDSDLPDGSGLDLCRYVYEEKQSLILVLSAKNTEKDVVKALQSGADDYIAKPFGMQEFLARVEAMMRRIRVNSIPLYLDYNDLKIDLVQRRVQYQGDFIDLTPQEFSLLYVLAQASGSPLSRSELLRRAWPDAIDNPRTIDTHVLSLRKKIEANPRQPQIIQTVRNVGYRLNPHIMTPENPQLNPTNEDETKSLKYTNV